MTKRLSYAAAVREKCKDCIYDPFSPGTWRQQVGECSSSNCGLHSVRPMPSVGRNGKPVSRLENASDDAEPTDAAKPDASALPGPICGTQAQSGHPQ